MLPKQAVATLQTSSSELSPTLLQQHWESRQLKPANVDTPSDQAEDCTLWQQPNHNSVASISSTSSLSHGLKSGSSNDMSWQAIAMLEPQLLDSFQLPDEVCEVPDPAASLELLGSFQGDGSNHPADVMPANSPQQLRFHNNSAAKSRTNAADDGDCQFWQMLNSILPPEQPSPCTASSPFLMPDPEASKGSQRSAERSLADIESGMYAAEREHEQRASQQAGHIAESDTLVIESPVSQGWIEDLFGASSSVVAFHAPASAGKQLQQLRGADQHRVRGLESAAEGIEQRSSGALNASSAPEQENEHGTAAAEARAMTTEAEHGDLKRRKSGTTGRSTHGQQSEEDTGWRHSLAVAVAKIAVSAAAGEVAPDSSLGKLQTSDWGQPIMPSADGAGRLQQRGSSAAAAGQGSPQTGAPSKQPPWGNPAAKQPNAEELLLSEKGTGAHVVKKEEEQLEPSPKPPARGLTLPGRRRSGAKAARPLRRRLASPASGQSTITRAPAQGSGSPSCSGDGNEQSLRGAERRVGAEGREVPTRGSEASDVRGRVPQGFGGITQGVIRAAAAQSGKRKAPVYRLEELHRVCTLTLALCT